MFRSPVSEGHYSMKAVFKIYLYRLAPPITTYWTDVVFPHTVKHEVGAVFGMLAPIVIYFNYIVHWKGISLSPHGGY